MNSRSTSAATASPQPSGPSSNLAAPSASRNVASRPDPLSKKCAAPANDSHVDTTNTRRPRSGPATGNGAAGDGACRATPSANRAGSPRRHLTVNANVDPRPGPSLRTVMSPPIRRTRRMLMARPSPVPPSRRVRVAFTCVNDVNSFAWSFAEMPAPVSTTSNSSVTRSSSSAAASDPPATRASSSAAPPASDPWYDEPASEPPNARTFEPTLLRPVRGALSESPDVRELPRRGAAAAADAATATVESSASPRASSDGPSALPPRERLDAPGADAPPPPPPPPPPPRSAARGSSPGASARTLSWTLPLAVNLTAFDMRFVTTCRRRISSPTSLHGTESSTT